MLLHELLEASARRRPDAAALIEPHRTTTYAALDALASRFCRLFLRGGVRRHDRVAIALENGREFAAAYFGALKAGAVAVPLPPGSRNDRLTRALEDCTPAACVFDTATAKALEGHAALTAVRHRVVIGRGGAGQVEALAAESDEPAAVRSIDADLAAIIYTSGTTGEPRGVMLTHRNLVTNAQSIVSYLRLTDDDRVMCVLPFYYVYGLSLLHTHVAVGGTVVIDNRFVFPNTVLNAMREQRVTGFAGVPSTFALLLHRSALDQTALPDLRYVTQAGGPMPPARIREWLARGPQVPFFVMYGATEAGARLAYLEPSMLLAKLGSIGTAIPNVEIVVLKDDGTVAQPGELGELVARGSNIARGYWNRPDETSERFEGGMYRTGDLGYADDDGYLFLVCRKHDMMKIGAHRVGAREIEDVLQDHPAVHEAAVVPAPDDLLGEVAVAFVSLRNPLEAPGDVLSGYCATRLPSYKVPVRFVVQDELPKIAGIGKIDRTSLRASLQTGA